MVAIFGYIGYQVYQEPESIKEFGKVGTQSFDEIVSWGRLKIGADGSNSKKKKYASFAEEMLLGGLEDDDEDENEEKQESGEDNGQNEEDA